MKNICPLESAEQETLASWLDSRGYIWFRVPNEFPSPKGKPSYGWLKAMAKRGRKNGVPDVIIVGRTTLGTGLVVPLRIAIELKRQEDGVLSPSQRQWLMELRKCGWHAECCEGVQDAITTIENLTAPLWKGFTIKERARLA